MVINIAKLFLILISFIYFLNIFFKKIDTMIIAKNPRIGVYISGRIIKEFKDGNFSN